MGEGDAVDNGGGEAKDVGNIEVLRATEGDDGAADVGDVDSDEGALWRKVSDCDVVTAADGKAVRDAVVPPAEPEPEDVALTGRDTVEFVDGVALRGVVDVNERVELMDAVDEVLNVEL